MAHHPPPQYLKNELQPVKTDIATLKSVRNELRAAIKCGIDLILNNYEAPKGPNNDAFGPIAYGALGIALMFLRLEAQAKFLDEDGALPAFRELAFKYMNLKPGEMQVASERPSPLCNPFLGAVTLRILAMPRLSESQPQGLNDHLSDDIAALHEVVQSSIQQNPTVERRGHSMGIDEVLLGRAGLLWALLNIRKIHHQDLALKPILDLIPELVNTIIEAGKLGTARYVEKHGEAGAFPLMWSWIDSYFSLGAMHGITGILTILLSCNASEIESHLPLIAHSITAICQLSVSDSGHLPMSIPPYPSSTSRSSPLVQICHGAPGLLLLLGAAKHHNQLNTYRTPKWDEAVRHSSQQIWDEGLLSKGGGLCHGIAGNAWPWLILAAQTSNIDKTSADGTLADDEFLSRSLAFLLHAQETPPFKLESRYRMPDNPYSLFEGLAGTICAWSEACVLISAKLMDMEDAGLADLGFPGLGGRGALGLL